MMVFGYIVVEAEIWVYFETTWTFSKIDSFFDHFVQGPATLRRRFKGGC